MKVTQSDIWLCPDCTQATVNDDYTGLNDSEAPRRMREIKWGLERLGPGLCLDSGTEKVRCVECDTVSLDSELPSTYSVEDGEDCKSCPECGEFEFEFLGRGEYEFSHTPCDCCGETLAGDRIRFAVLGEELECQKKD